MWCTLSCLAFATFATGQPPAPAGMKLTNVRPVFGDLGGTRTETPLLPGDIYTVAFDIEGITVNENNQARYSLALETLDSSGKVWFKREPVSKTDYVFLGGNRIPARAFVGVGLQQPPGDYTMRVIVTDEANKASQSFERKFTVLPKGFGIVAINTTYDDKGQMSLPNTLVVGQSMFLHFGVVGFQRDPKTKQPRVREELLILDESGQPTLAKPLSHVTESGLGENEEFYNLRFLLPMTRPGKFNLKLTITDMITNKTASVTLPVTSLPASN